MSRPLRARALLPLTLLVAAACQDYNFNPVGHCMVQPGTERFTLSNVSTADVLFVVDDSGSMGAEQAKLAANFSRFVSNLDATNTARVSKGLQPIDFHLAVTTTSIFWNYGPSVNATCSSSCGSAAGKTVCCASGAPVLRPARCSGPGASCPGGATCSASCQRLAGEYFCCNGADGTPVPAAEEPLSCALDGQPCGGLDHHYQFNASCTATSGLAADGYPYPQGDFVSWSSGASVNPRVLHFDKELYPATPTAGVTPTNRQGFTSAQLVASFVGGTGVGGAPVKGNVVVGTCGSGQEQGLQAARLAVQKALAKQQKDTWTAGAGSVVAWDPTNRVASASADWPHDGAKLVLVFIGDEDDCSSPDDASRGIVMGPEAPGQDACTTDSALDPSQQKEFQVQEFVDYFASLGRPLAAAFIESASTTACGRPLATGETIPSPGSYAAACTAGVCCQLDCAGYQNVCGPSSAPAYCGGQAAGFRFFAAANALRAKTINGVHPEVVQGSVCDPNFGEILNQIAEILKPPAGLVLPTPPASGDVVLLRIAQTNGQTRKICTGPAPAGTSGAALGAYDWWFTASKDPGAPVAVSEFVYINHDTGNCEANPGETYSADYVARNPEGGCASRAACQSALGGTLKDWGCYMAPGASVGTCICCAAGSTDPACQ